MFTLAFDAALTVFRASKDFPREETYSLTDQIRRSSRSVCANIAEAWLTRRYVGAFIGKVSDAEAEAAETQVWIAFALKCEYLPSPAASELNQTYDFVIGKLLRIIANPQPGLPPRPPG